MLLTVWRNTFSLVMVLEAVSLLLFFYVYFSDRLAYTFLKAGLYMAVIIQIGHANPAAAQPEGWQLFLAVVVGVVVANLVSWYTGMERDCNSDRGAAAVAHRPPTCRPQPDAGRGRRRWRRCFTVWLELPTSTTLVSVMLLTITPDIHSLLAEGGAAADRRPAGRGVCLWVADIAPATPLFFSAVGTACFWECF